MPREILSSAFRISSGQRDLPLDKFLRDVS